MLEKIDTGAQAPGRDRRGPAAGDGFVLESRASDNQSRWTPGMRLDRLFSARASALATEVAVEEPDGRRVSFSEMDAAASRLARHLIKTGIGVRSRVGILLDNGLDSFVAMLAVMRAGAAFVPLDLGFPKDRIAYILEDAGAEAVITRSSSTPRLPDGIAIIIEVDACANDIGAQPPSPPKVADADGDALCYIIYTSGTTGRPKGVQIDHSNICNFILVAAETYGIAPGARMYQGLTIAFDFSFEEIWVPLFSGATLIPSPPGLKPVGEDLHAYLVERRVTALCAVPTLLATIETDLPNLGFLLVSGEACPQDLIARWWRADRRFLNAYGPTEATVTATLAVVAGVSSVTIGMPLPTYKVIILAPQEAKALERGAVGEIALAGPGLSRGYLNRPDLTERAFVADFLRLDDNPTGTLYRTGDLGRINENGEVEYLGRIDTQVKVRGYRIELTEIESIILATPGIAQAVVEPFRPRPGQVELVAYYTLSKDATTEPGAINAELRAKLPPYMVPTYFERLDLIPMLPSDKADRKSLPVPKGERFAAEGSEYEAPKDGLEQLLAGLIGEMLGISQVSATAHLFEELGANSLIIARLTARLRALRKDLTVSIKDVYLNPSIRGLASAISEHRTLERPRPSSAPPLRAGRAAYIASAFAQAGIYLLSLIAYGALFVESVDYVNAAPTVLTLVGRALLMGIATMLVTCCVPIAAKWLLVGRWKKERFAIWGLKYLRFWTVRALIRTCPLALTAGTPLFTFYLRLLGARIGRNVIIVGAKVPVATDLLTIGDDTVIGKDVWFSGYRCENGGLEIGPVEMGRDCVVGDNAVLDIHVSIGDGGHLVHASALLSGQSIPSGQTWHGSPARPASPLPRALAARLPRHRALFFAVGQLVFQWLIAVPVGLLCLVAFHRLGSSESFHPLAAMDNAFVGGLVLYSAGILAAAAAVLLVPRLAWLGLRTGRDYPLYGLRYWLFRVVAKRSNSNYFNILFGDSSFILHYLKAVGYRLSLKGQTGSNFGLVQRHDVPFATTVGNGTLVSDGLTVSNAVFSASGFRIEDVKLGTSCFIGNSVLYPAGARTGDNCLLATKVMVPVSGPRLEGVGLLGSPPIQIPRSVSRDRALDISRVPGAFERQLRLKTRSNLGTIGLFLISRWFLFAILIVIADAAFEAHGLIGSLVLGASIFAMTVTAALFYILVERLSLGFRRLSPQTCSIYDPYFWFHERYWKLNDATFIQILNGTPFKGMVWRLLGVRWGRMNFDDGCSITERTLVNVGDCNTFGDMAVLQSHSLEDGVFKSDFVTVGTGCTVSAKAYVSYGTRLEDGALVEPDAFVMKGETLEAGSVWAGNPALKLG